MQSPSNSESLDFASFRSLHARPHAADENIDCAEIPGAEYVRMSTEHQRYSIENQQIAIAAYALKHQIRIVRSYIDPGKSGLRIERRDALQQLINDVQSGEANFRTILVYDVSRWGRFQDIDESAYYEFICKKGGAPIRYCAEQFENDGTLLAQIIKGLKRAMAGEYSRELSVKVFEGHTRGALRGLHQGGMPAYGLRRLLVDEFGSPRSVLTSRERKHFQTDHVVLAPGPPSEIRTVRRIYRLFVHSRMPRNGIAQLLNREGHPNAVGNRWTNNNVLRVLTNEKYLGNLVYGMTSKKLQGPTYRNPRDSWIRVNGVMRRIVDSELFTSAQRILADPWWSFTENHLLDHLTAAFCKKGYLNSQIISKSKFTPAVPTYRARFGSLSNAYRLIGYKRTHGYYHWNPDLLCPMHRNLISQLISIVARHGGVVEFDELLQTLRLNGKSNVAVVIIPYSRPKTDTWGWTLRLYYFPKCDLILVGRLDKANIRLIDYHLLPRSACPRTILRFTERRLGQFRPYKLKSITSFYEKSQKLLATLAVTMMIEGSPKSP